MKKQQNIMIFILAVTLLMSAVSLQPDKDFVLTPGEVSDTAIIYQPNQEQADIISTIVSEGRTLRQSLMISSRMRVRADYNRSRLGVAFLVDMAEGHRISNIFYMSVTCGYNVRVSSNVSIISFIHNQDGQKA